MALDSGIAAVLKQMSALPPFESMPVADARGLMAKMSRSREEPLAVRTVEDRVVETDADNVPIRVYSDVDAARGILVFFHGGGWALGSMDGADPIARKLAVDAKVCVVSVGYRLAPESPFPAALDDGRAVVRWTQSLRGDLAAPDACIIVGGESSGANLATVVALLQRDEGLPVDGQLLFYPVTSARCDTPSYREHGQGLFLTRDAMKWFWGMYVADEQLRSDSRVSPLLADDLSNLGRILVQTGEYDPVRDEGEAYAQRLTEAGNDVSLQRREGLIHGFVGMAQVSSAVREAIKDAASWLQHTVEKCGK